MNDKDGKHKMYRDEVLPYGMERWLCNKCPRVVMYQPESGYENAQPEGEKVPHASPSSISRKKRKPSRDVVSDLSLTERSIALLKEF